MILNRENMRNKKVILILCLLVLVSGSVQAQRLKAVQNEKGRYGFMTEDGTDRKSTRLNSSHTDISRMPSSA